jgi:hypothetical protein
MKSLVIFSYNQPVKGSRLRWGILENRRDTVKNPVHQKSKEYRKDDSQFRRSKDLDFVRTASGLKSFYRQRQTWKIKIPFIGSLLKTFIKS